jgi:hypothetical protein
LRRLFLIGLSACVTFPEEELVEDLRIIDIRTTPPEIPIFTTPVLDADLDRLASLEPNHEPVTVTALMAHPDLDAAFEVDWIRCRFEDGTGFGRVPCGGRFKERLPTDPGDPAIARFSPIELLEEDLAEAMSFEGAIASLASDPRDLFAGLRAFINVEARVARANIEVDTASLEGTKRLVIFDPTTIALVLREARSRGAGAIPMIAGLDLPTLCTNVTEDEFDLVLDYLGSRVPNRAPRYDRIEGRREGQIVSSNLTPRRKPTGELTHGFGGALRPGWPPSTVRSEDTLRRASDGLPTVLRPGEAIILRGRVRPEDIEDYRLIDDHCGLVSFSETMSWSWFTNAGQLSSQVTNETKISFEDAETVYRAPLEDELDEDVTRVRIWSVLRDGRGGSDSRSIDLVIQRGG